MRHTHTTCKVRRSSVVCVCGAHIHARAVLALRAARAVRTHHMRSTTAIIETCTATKSWLNVVASTFRDERLSELTVQRESVFERLLTECPQRIEFHCVVTVLRKFVVTSPSRVLPCGLLLGMGHL